MSDASEVMDLLLKTHTDLPDDDPQTSYLISAWARICKIMGKLLIFYTLCQIIFFFVDIHLTLITLQNLLANPADSSY